MTTFARASIRHENTRGMPGIAGRSKFQPAEGMILLDVVGDTIAFIEVLYREDVRSKLISLLLGPSR